jgi:hypothetical protein
MRSVHAGLEAQNEAAEIKIRAERRLGQELMQLEKAVGGRPSEKTPDVVSGVSDGNGDSQVTLADLGISYKQSSQWQLLAFVPQDEFDKQIAKVKAGGTELSTAGMVRFGRRFKKKQLSPPEEILESTVDGETPTTCEIAETTREVLTTPKKAEPEPGLATKEQNQAGSMIEPDDAETLGEMMEVSEGLEP